MALSKVFKTKLVSTLKSKLKNFNVVDIENEHEKVINGINSIYSDFLVKLNFRNLEILLEIERHRPDPIHNLIKTLIWLEEKRPSYPVMLLHVFDEAYYKNDKLNKFMCEFIYSKLREYYPRFCYHTFNVSGLAQANSVPPEFPPSKISNGIADRVALLIKKTGKIL